MDEGNSVVSDRDDHEYVDFRHAGDQAKGEYHCSSCGYGVAVFRTLPQCPMCSGTTWEASAWSPFARAREAAPA
jgi:rubrerythrin